MISLDVSVQTARALISYVVNVAAVHADMRAHTSQDLQNCLKKTSL